MRALGRRQIFLRNAEVIEALARVDTVVFDKTGTLTTPHAGPVTWNGVTLDAGVALRIAAVARQSTHPLSARLAGWLETRHPGLDVAGAPVESFRELAGAGVEGVVAGPRKAQQIIQASSIIDCATNLVGVYFLAACGFELIFLRI